MMEHLKKLPSNVSDQRKAPAGIRPTRCGLKSEREGWTRLYEKRPSLPSSTETPLYLQKGSSKRAFPSSTEVLLYLLVFPLLLYSNFD